MAICSSKTDSATWRRYVCDRLDGLGEFPLGLLAGLTTSNGTDADHDINIAAGEARDAADGVNLVLSATLVKQIDADWASGSNAGGFPTALTLSADTWYYVFLIGSETGTLVDAGFDTALDASNLLTDATGYSVYRRIGAVLTDGSSNIIGFTQVGNEFRWKARVLDHDDITTSTTAASRSVTVPSGITVQALLHAAIYTTTATTTRIYSPFEDEPTVGADNYDLRVDSSVVGQETDIALWTATGAVVEKSSVAATTSLSIFTRGWVDSFESFVISGNSKGSAELFVNGTPVETTSGSEAAFTGLPEGLDCIQLVCKDVSLSGTDHLILQLGDSVTGGYLTSGYTGSGSRYGSSVVTAASTNGARIYLAAATESFTGVIHISRLDSSTDHWVISTSGSSSDSTAISFTTGSEIVLAGPLDRLRLIPSASNTFGEGKINIKYDNPDERTVVTNTYTVNNTFTGAEPAGVLHAYAGFTAPSGYLECDGSAVSRTTYATLFGIVGTRYGAGNGSTTFNVPDLRGQFIRGWDHGAGTDPDAASRTDSGNGTTGDNVGTKQADAFKAHLHAMNADSRNVPKRTGFDAIIDGTSATSSVNDADYSGSQDTGNTGGNETRPTNVYMMYIIKT